MKAAIVCVALLAIVSSTSLMERFPQTLNGRSMMSLMVQIEAHIKSGGPYDAIQIMLKDFEDEIKQEQVDHTELFEENKKSCEEEFQFRSNAIREAEGAVKEAQTTLDSCTTQLARAKQDLKASENFLSNARTSLGTLERQRLAEAEIFEKDQTAYKSLINGIGEVLIMVDELGAGDQNANFVQLSKHANKLILMAAEVSAVHHLSEVMTALVQMKDANTNALIQKLKGLFEGFKADTIAKQKKSIEAEAAAIDHYNKQKARLTATIAKLTEQIEALEEEIAELEQCISTQQGLLSSAQAKLSRNTNLLNSAQSVCAASEKSYEQQTAARKDELELLLAIKEKVKERYGEISNEHGTIDRASQDGDEIKNSYQNASEYDNKKFEGY